MFLVTYNFKGSVNAYFLTKTVEAFDTDQHVLMKQITRGEVARGKSSQG